MTSSAGVWNHGCSLRYGNKRDTATPSAPGIVPPRAIAHVRLMLAGRAISMVCLQASPLPRRRWTLGTRPPGSSSICWASTIPR